MEEIFVPASGMAMEDVLFAEWLKQPGDEVAPGEPVAVVETDKATVELSGTGEGRLSRHLVEVGARVPGGTTVAYLLGDGESEPGAAAVAAAAAAGGSPAAATTSPPPLDAPSPTIVARPGREPDGRHRLSPRQRRAFAAAATADVGTPDDSDGAPPVTPRVGPDRRQEAPVVAVPAGGNVIELEPGLPATAAAASGNRRATAALVTESWRTVPHFSVGRDVRVDGLLEAVSAAKAAGAAVTVTDFLLLGLAQALEMLGEPSDVGLAVATEWGVLIPVVRSPAGRSLSDVATLRQAAVGRARHRRLGSFDSAPVFATLSNLGPAGVTWFTGVVPTDQVALLTVGEISLRPAVEGRAVVVAPMLTAVVTADHRRYDGTDSAKLLGTFVERLAALVENGRR